MIDDRKYKLLSKFFDNIYGKLTHTKITYGNENGIRKYKTVYYYFDKYLEGEPALILNDDLLIMDEVKKKFKDMFDLSDKELREFFSIKLSEKIIHII
jgi:hypothetical protein